MKAAISQRLVFGGYLARAPLGYLGSSGSRLITWLGMPQFSQRSWGRRLPAVLAASPCLALFLWFGGFRLEEVATGLSATLLGAALAVSRMKPE